MMLVIFIHHTLSLFRQRVWWTINQKKMKHSCRACALAFIAVFVAAKTTSAYRPSMPKQNHPSISTENTMVTRRSTLLAFPAAALLLATSPSNANAADGKTMSDDEALCKFGSPSKKVGDACVRAGLSTKRKTGVDAYGNVDREYLYNGQCTMLLQKLLSRQRFHTRRQIATSKTIAAVYTNDCS